MWIKGNYRRNLMDMHIADWNEEFLSKLNCDEYVNGLVDADIQAAMVKAKPHTGLNYYPGKIGRMHNGLNGHDFLGEMIEKCHKNNIAVVVYYSQIFDNWAAENHPEWRCVDKDGISSNTFGFQHDPKLCRYGLVCPNNEEYREYVKANLQEICANYDFEGMFLDMTFWPQVCYCKSCREKYKKQTGKEMPVKVDFSDKEFIEFTLIRDRWIAEFAKLSTDAAKAIKSNVTIEHQLSQILCRWVSASSEYMLDAVDYAGGDYYEGFLYQTISNKYYKSISPNLPFVHHTSRCDPALHMHTTTKTKEQMVLHVITALVHNGAFLLVDAINPDGSVVPEVYHDLMKGVYQVTKPYEKYVSGDMISDVDIWFSTHSKFTESTDGLKINEEDYDEFVEHRGSSISMAAIMRNQNILFDVIGSVNLDDIKAKVLVVSHAANISDSEADKIISFVSQGGSVYISGHIGNDKIAKMLGVIDLGMSDYNFWYMRPTDGGKELFTGFSERNPMTVPSEYRKIKADDTSDVLATVTLPYTHPINTNKFSAIHSNPPGVYTDEPAIICKAYGKGKCIYSAAPIENSQPYISKLVVGNIIKFLIGDTAIKSNAPAFVEILGWKKEGHTYFAVINQQDELPVASMYDIYLDVPGVGKKAVQVIDNKELETENINDMTRIYLPKLDIFNVIEII